MPRRAAPGDRRKIEDALPDELHRALNTLCELFGIPLGLPAERLRGWQSTGLQDVFETAAVCARVRELTDRGMPAESAERNAAADLCVPWETCRTRIRRWHRAARRTKREAEPDVHNEPAAGLGSA